MSGMAKQGRVIYQTDQCLISADGDRTPRIDEMEGRDAKTMRINIKMVIRCPSASNDIEPGFVAPPSSPAEKLSPDTQRSPPTLDEANSKTSSDIVHFEQTDKYSTIRDEPHDGLSSHIKTQSAPPGTRAAFGKPSENNDRRTLSTKRPPNYVWGFTRQPRNSLARSKVVVRPFSERRRTAENVYCFTCRRTSNTSRHLSGGGPEMGFFKGKPPLTPFTRLGCYRSQLKSTFFKFPGRPGSNEDAGESTHDSDGEIPRPPHTSLPPPSGSSGNSYRRGNYKVKQRTVSEVIAEKLNLKEDNSSQAEPLPPDPGEKGIVESRVPNGKDYSYFFVKRNGLVKGWVSNEQAKETKSSTEPTNSIINSTSVENKPLPPFRRNLQSNRVPARWRAFTTTSSQFRRQESRNTDVATENKRYLPKRVTLTPFQKRRYCI